MELATPVLVSIRDQTGGFHGFWTRRVALAARRSVADHHPVGALLAPLTSSPMTNYAKLPTWADKSHVYAVVETPRGSHAKLEFDPKLHVFTLSKPLLIGLSYPYDWGFIPSTKADDGDPIDVLIVHEPATYPGLVLCCTPIGILEILQIKKERKSGMTASSWCRIGRHLRRISPTFDDCQSALCANSSSFSRRLMHLRTRSWNSLAGTAHRKLSKQ